MIANRLDASDTSWLPSAEDGTVVIGSAPFSVLVHQPESSVVVVSVVGEIDLLTASTLRDQLNRVLAAGPTRLVIDLTHTSFLGATALSLLINVRRAAAQRDATLQLIAPKRALPARALKTTGLDRLFEFVPSSSNTNSSQERHSGRNAEVPRPRAARRIDTTEDPTSPRSSVATAQDDYAHLIPLQRRWAELAADDPQRHRLRDQLIDGYLPVAEHLARRFAGRGEPLEDLIQVATVGLINAVDRFEPARGSHFLSFAVPTISGEIRRYFRDHGWSTRVPRRLKDLSLAIRQATAELSQQLGHSPRPSEIAQRLGVSTATVIEALHAAEAYRSSSLDDLLGCGETIHTFLGELDAQMCLIDDRETLRLSLAQLTPRQRTILKLRFFQQLTQAEIAEQVGISQMHVSRVLRQTLDFLHQHMTDSKQSHSRNKPPTERNARRSRTQGLNPKPSSTGR